MMHWSPGDPSNEVLIQKLPVLITNQSTMIYARKNITAFIPESSENIHEEDDYVSDDSDTTDNTTSTIANISAALDSVHNLTLSASQVEDTDGLQFLHHLRMHYENQLLNKWSHQTKISDFF